MTIVTTEETQVKSDNPTFNAGLDMKYGITSNLVMDLTVNTDFAQVESDDQQVNLSRFSLYFPEKRIFFLERANVFDFSLGGNNNMFYSRRIGLSEDGRPVRIYGGFRLTGRIGKWDLGILDMQTAAYTGEPMPTPKPCHSHPRTLCASFQKTGNQQQLIHWCNADIQAGYERRL